MSQKFPENKAKSDAQVASSCTLSAQETHALLVRRHGAERQAKLSAASVGIAGLGGLGSHVAFFLARLGVGRMVLVDFDVVDQSNLHRQNYRFSDLGFPKSQALISQLKEINPYLNYEGHNLKLNAENIPQVFAGCDIICEAFDDPIQKAMLTECVLTQFDNSYLVGASGMAGVASPNKITAKAVMKRYILCGDGVSDVAQLQSLFAPRVALCAAKQATVIMQLILDELDLSY